MAASSPRTAADRLRQQADVLLTLADQFESPSRSTARAERLIAEVEQVATDVRAVVRGRR